MKKIAIRYIFFPAALLLGSFHLWAAEGIISKTPAAENKFCHLKFPAISETTLFSDRPTLTDPSERDIVDFYGPCDYDPLGRDSIVRQQREYRLRMQREYGRD